MITNDSRGSEESWRSLAGEDDPVQLTAGEGYACEAACLKARHDVDYIDFRWLADASFVACRLDCLLITTLFIV